MFLYICQFILKRFYNTRLKIMKPQQQPKLCKFGPTCKFLHNNSCHYYHPPQSSVNRNGRIDYDINSNQYEQQSQRRSKSRGKKNYSYSQQNHSNQYSRNLTPRQNSPFRGKLNQNQAKPFCKFYQLGAVCKFGDKCQKKHDFTYGNGVQLRRLMQRRDIPNNSVSRLTKLEYGQKELFALRQGNQVFLFEYLFQKNEIIGLGQPYLCPQAKSKYEFYDQRGHHIYYSCENEITKLVDLGFQNIFTKESSWIANSHTSKLTSIFHYDENTVFSSSNTGEIKVWVRSHSTEGFVVHKELTAVLAASFNPHSLPLEILYLNMQEVDGVKVVMAGTNNGRLIFWTGNSFDYMEIPLKQCYTKVYKIKLAKLEGTLVAFVLSWNADNTYSSVILINLQTGSLAPIQEVQTNERYTTLIHNFQFHDGSLLIGNIRGDISIYSIRQQCQKIGAILHNNMVNDMICSNFRMATTSLTIKLFYVLEKKTAEHEGSFSIYLMQ